MGYYGLNILEIRGKFLGVVTTNGTEEFRTKLHATRIEMFNEIRNWRRKRDRSNGKGAVK